MATISFDTNVKITDEKKIIEIKKAIEDTPVTTIKIIPEDENKKKETLKKWFLR